MLSLKIVKASSFSQKAPAARWFCIMLRRMKKKNDRVWGKDLNGGKESSFKYFMDIAAKNRRINLMQI
jgi:hypothetical protein